MLCFSLYFSLYLVYSSQLLSILFLTKTSLTTTNKSGKKWLTKRHAFQNKKTVNKKAHLFDTKMQTEKVNCMPVKFYTKPEWCPASHSQFAHFNSPDHLLPTSSSSFRP